MLQGLPFLLLHFRWQRQLDLLSPKISTTASFIPRFSPQLGRSFRVAADNSSFTPANRIIVESPVVGLFLADWIQHTPSVISLRKGEELRKLQEHSQTPGLPISIHAGAQLALPQPQGLWGHPQEPELGSQSVRGHFAFKNGNLSPVRKGEALPELHTQLGSCRSLR